MHRPIRFHRPIRSGLLGPGALLLALAIAGCAAEEPPPQRAEPVPRPELPDALIDAPAGFDETQSAGLLADAAAAEARGDPDAARRLYEQAALLWPDNLEAWRRLAALAEEPEKRRAAAFVAERVALHPSDALYTQRELSRVLDLYVAEQASLPEANETQLAYALRLSDFYRHLYAERGSYEPLRPVWDF